MSTMRTVQVVGHHQRLEMAEVLVLEPTGGGSGAEVSNLAGSPGDLGDDMGDLGDMGDAPATDDLDAGTIRGRAILTP